MPLPKNRWGYTPFHHPTSPPQSSPILPSSPRTESIADLLSVVNQKLLDAQHEVFTTQLNQALARTDSLATMAEQQPAVAGDVEEDVPIAKSAEDRKAAAALSSLDAPREDDSAGKDVDREAVKKAMDRLAGTGTTNGTTIKKDEKPVVKKAVKVDQADVTILMDELDLTKAKATDLLKTYDGDIMVALRAFVNNQ